MSKLSRNLRKKLSAGLAVIMAVSLAIPAGVSFSSQTVKAEGLTSETKDGDAFYDFRDGSVVPTDTDGKKDISYGGLTIKVGTKNAFKYNDAAHGVRFNDGNALEIAVSGPTKITLGGCQYSATDTITATSADSLSFFRTACCFGDFPVVDGITDRLPLCSAAGRTGFR